MLACDEGGGRRGEEGTGLPMACRVIQSLAVKLWMTSPSICKQVALERWGGVWAWDHVSMSVLAEEARCRGGVEAGAGLGLLLAIQGFSQVSGPDDSVLHCRSI